MIITHSLLLVFQLGASYMFTDAETKNTLEARNTGKLLSSYNKCLFGR